MKKIKAVIVLTLLIGGIDSQAVTITTDFKAPGLIANSNVALSAVGGSATPAEFTNCGNPNSCNILAHVVSVGPPIVYQLWCQCNGKALFLMPGQ